MKTSFNILRLLGLLGCLVAATSAACNECSTVNKLACYSKNQYQVCDENSMPTGKITKCPKGYVCSSGTAGVLCLLEAVAPAVDPTACVDCNKCDTTEFFACTGTKTYALCQGGTKPGDLTGTCKEGFVCNFKSTDVCVSNTTAAPTCSYADDPVETITTTTTTTTKSPVLPPTSDPEVYCTVVKSQDYFPAGIDPATTCRQYIYCYQLNNSWSGKLYTCPENRYYNPATKDCVKALPATCSAAVATLSFRGILLE